MGTADFIDLDIRSFLEENWLTPIGANPFLHSGANPFLHWGPVDAMWLVSGLGNEKNFDLHMGLGILDRETFEAESDTDAFMKSLDHIEHATSISPLATMAMRRKLYDRIGLNCKVSADDYFENTPYINHGKDVITAITLALVWAAACGTIRYQTDEFYAEWTHFYLAAKNSRGLRGFDELNSAINEIAKISASNMWAKSSIEDARDVFNKMIQKAKELDLHNLASRVERKP